MTFNIGGFSPEDKNYIKDLGIDPASDNKADDISLEDFKKAKEKIKEKFDEAVSRLFVKLNEKDQMATEAFLQALAEKTTDEVAQDVIVDAQRGFKGIEVEAAGIKDDAGEIKNIAIDLFMGKIDTEGYNKLNEFLNLPANAAIKQSFNKFAAEYANSLFNWISSKVGDGEEGFDGRVLENTEKIGKAKDQLIQEGNALDAYVLMITARDYVPDANDSIIESFKEKLEQIMAAEAAPAAPPPAPEEERPPGANPDQFVPNVESDINDVFGGIKGKNAGVEATVKKLFLKQLITPQEYADLKKLAETNNSFKQSLNNAAHAYADYFLKEIGAYSAPISGEIKANLGKIADAMNALGKADNDLDELVLIITAMYYPAGKGVLIPEFEAMLDKIVKPAETAKPQEGERSDAPKTAPPAESVPQISVEELEQALAAEKSALEQNQADLTEANRKLKRIEFMEKTFKATKGFESMKKNKEIKEHTWQWIEDNIIKKFRSKLATQAVNAADYNNLSDKISAFQAYANYLKLTKDGASDLETEKAAAQGQKDNLERLIPENKKRITELTEQIKKAKEAAKAAEPKPAEQKPEEQKPAEPKPAAPAAKTEKTTYSSEGNQATLDALGLSLKQNGPDPNCAVESKCDIIDYQRATVKNTDTLNADTLKTLKYTSYDPEKVPIKIDVSKAVSIKIIGEPKTVEIYSAAICVYNNDDTVDIIRVKGRPKEAEAPAVPAEKASNESDFEKSDIGKEFKQSMDETFKLFTRDYRNNFINRLHYPGANSNGVTTPEEAKQALVEIIDYKNKLFILMDKIHTDYITKANNPTKSTTFLEDEHKAYCDLYDRATALEKFEKEISDYLSAEEAKKVKAEKPQEPAAPKQEAGAKAETNEEKQLKTAKTNFIAKYGEKRPEWANDKVQLRALSNGLFEVDCNPGEDGKILNPDCAIDISGCLIIVYGKILGKDKQIYQQKLNDNNIREEKDANGVYRFYDKATNQEITSFDAFNKMNTSDLLSGNNYFQTSLQPQEKEEIMRLLQQKNYIFTGMGYPRTASGYTFDYLKIEIYDLKEKKNKNFEIKCDNQYKISFQLLKECINNPAIYGTHETTKESDSSWER